MAFASHELEREASWAFTFTFLGSRIAVERTLVGGGTTMKLIDPRTHGYIDYIYDAIFLIAPSLFGFSATAANISYSFMLLHFGMNLITRYPLGLFRWLPFPVHGGIELVASILMILMPWIAGFAPDDLAGRNFFVIAGLALLGVWGSTNYRSTLADTSGNVIDSRSYPRAS
jgi:hypothetical protein